MTGSGDDRARAGPAADGRRPTAAGVADPVEARATQCATAAAQRVLQAAHGGAAVPPIDLGLAAWTLGRQGLRPPSLPAPVGWLVDLAAMLGADEVAPAVALLDEALAEPGQEPLLMHACHLAGHRHPDALIALAERHPDAWFNGAMLAGTSRPQALLALSAAQRVSSAEIITVGELVLRARDGGPACAEAEARWQALMDESARWVVESRFRDTHLRLLARRGLDEAADCLQRYGRGHGRDTVFTGPVAVLARLVRERPADAVALVADADTAAERAAWLLPLCWWFELPAPAQRLATTLVDGAGAELAPTLLEAIARTTQRPLLNEALRRAQAAGPAAAEQILRATAPAMSQLHAAGLHARAEALREALWPALAGARACEGAVAAQDLADVLGAPGLPPLVPWGQGPGLP